MTNPSGGRPRRNFRVGPALLLTSAVAGGLWLGFAVGGVPGLLTAAGLMLTAALGAVGLIRLRAARRWARALDAYAEREIARVRPVRAPQAVR